MSVFEATAPEARRGMAGAHKINVCPDHALRLIDGTDERRMGHLVGTRPFDPLASAETFIWLLAFQQFGLIANTRNPEGTKRCPCCEADRRHGSGTGDAWIKLALDEMQKYGVEHGHLAPTTNKKTFGALRDFAFRLVGQEGRPRS